MAEQEIHGIAEVKIQNVQQHDSDGGDVEGGAACPMPAEKVELSKEQRALRWKNHIAALCMYVMVAFTFASSPLVDSLNSLASEMSPTWHWLAPGITVFATLNICSNLIILPTVGSVLKLLKYEGMLIWLTSLSGALLPLSIGLATSTKQLWIAYLGAVLASPAFVIGLESGKVMVVQWWALDGKQRFGVALLGGTVGVMILLMTLALGYTCSYWGVAWAAYSHATLLVIVSFWPLHLARRGELGPPSVDAKASMARELPTRNWSCSFSFYQIGFHSIATSLPSFGMKILLTSIFQSSYGVSFLTSANMSAATLILFAVARAAFPYYAKPGCVMPMLTAMLLLTGTLYGSYPAIIQHLPIWSLALAKTITGGCFAGVISMQSLLLLEVYEPEELPAVFMKLEPFSGIGWAFGPAIGYYLNLLQESRGVGDRSTYDLFFYISAALYFAATFNMAVLHARLSACQKKAHAQGPA